MINILKLKSDLFCDKILVFYKIILKLKRIAIKKQIFKLKKVLNPINMIKTY